MDEMKYLTGEIRRCRRRMNLAKVLDYGILAAAGAGILGIFCEAASLVWEFYYVHLAAGLCFGLGLVSGVGYGVYKRADMMQAAGRLDSFGLKERMITAWEQRGREDAFARLQRQDAAAQYDRVREQIKIPLRPRGRHVCALILCAAVTAALGFLSSPVRDQARLRHQVQEQAKEEQEKLAELSGALEQVDLESLSEEQRAQLVQLSEALGLSMEELAGADSWEHLAAAGERLDFKYQQAAQSLAQLASMLDDPRAAGVAGAQALAKAAAGGGQSASSGTPAGGSGEGGDSSLGDGSEGGEGDGSGGEGSEGEGSQGGSQGGNGSGSEGSQGGSGGGSQGGSQGGNGSENGGSQSGSGTGSQGGSQGGSGSGSGGSQGGNGSGGGGSQGGSGSGAGNGGGRGTGHSETPHEYVSVPNGVGEDGALTGGRDGDSGSDYYRQQNGLAWEGNHVDYNSVIGEYTDSAYEGIASGRYPGGMENVIRDYFENLNK